MYAALKKKQELFQVRQLQIFYYWLYSIFSFNSQLNAGIMFIIL